MRCFMFFKKKQNDVQIQMSMYVIKDIISESTAGDPFFNKNDIAVQRELLSFIKNEKEKGNNVRVREMQLYKLANISTDMRVLAFVEPQYICSLADLEKNIDDYLKSQGL